MSQAAKAQEPSMEEILASIRRIIAEDDAGKTTKASDPAATKAAAAPSRPTLLGAETASDRNSQDDIDAMLAETENSAESTPVEDDNTVPKPAAEPVPDVLVLTEAMTAQQAPPAKPAAQFRTIDGSSDVVFTEKAAEASPPQEPARPTEEPRRQFSQAGMSDRALMSSATAAAVDSAFNSLAHTVLGNNARTLEDLVKEMLRPMLKSWLDDNLPGLVERIVRAEIERVSRGRG
jgi:cell pole-organizing protein PopZ